MMFDFIEDLLRIAVRAWSGMILVGMAHHEISNEIQPLSYLLCFALTCFSMGFWRAWREQRAQARS